MCDLSALSIFLPLLCSGGTKSDYPLRSGTWEGAGAFIQIDAQSMLGNIDSERHFQRDPIFITAMSGKDVSFYIGPRLFRATFTGDTLYLWRDRQLEPRILLRHKDSKSKPASLNLRATF